MKRPLLQYHPLHFDGHGLNAPGGDRILNFSRHPQSNGGDYILSRETHEAIAKPIQAIPVILATLENTYLRACETVASQEAQMKRRRKAPWHSAKRVLNLLTERRDEYKTALIAAGYSFD